MRHEQSTIAVIVLGSVTTPGRYTLPYNATVGDAIVASCGLAALGDPTFREPVPSDLSHLYAKPSKGHETWTYPTSVLIATRKGETRRIRFSATEDWDEIILEDGDMLSFPEVIY